MKRIKELDRVALVRDFPEEQLKAGDPGTVVSMHVDGTIIVEFIDSEGFVVGMPDLSIDDVRKATEADKDTRAVGRRDLFYDEVESQPHAR